MLKLMEKKIVAILRSSGSMNSWHAIYPYIQALYFCGPHVSDLHVRFAGRMK